MWAVSPLHSFRRRRTHRFQSTFSRAERPTDGARSSAEYVGYFTVVPGFSTGPVTGWSKRAFPTDDGTSVSSLRVERVARSVTEFLWEKKTKQTTQGTRKSLKAAALLIVWAFFFFLSLSLSVFAVRISRWPPSLVAGWIFSSQLIYDRLKPINPCRVFMGFITEFRLVLPCWTDCCRV